MILINSSKHFKRSYKKLPRNFKEDFNHKIKIFIQNPRDQKLQAHKLKGKLKECMSFYLLDGYRVLFRFSAKNKIDLLDVGPHDKYRNWEM